MFKKEVNTGNIEEMFDFLKNHFSYYDRWSNCRQVANDVKVHHLALEGSAEIALNMLYYTNYYEVNFLISTWLESHPGCDVGFSGSSGGYLLLKYTDNTVLPDCVTDCRDSNDLKDYIKENGLLYTMQELQEATEMVQSFDALTDELRECTNELSKCNIQAYILDDVLYKFNEEYENDLTLFNIDALEFNEEYNAIDVTNIINIKCLFECLTKAMAFISEYGYCLEEFKKDGKVFITFK